MKESYNVKIVGGSREFTARERLKLKDTGACIALDAATQEGELIIAPAGWAELLIHNDKSEDKDYSNYVVIDTAGNMYVTGSNSFFEAFKDIWDEMVAEAVDGATDPYEIRVYRIESKNYKGKSFITCSIV